MEKPNFDEMTPKQVREWGSEIANHAAQFSELRATLIVNCQSGRALHGVGIAYDECKPALTNLVSILEQLVNRVQNQATIEFLPKTADGVRIVPGTLLHHPTEGSFVANAWLRADSSHEWLIQRDLPYLESDPVSVGECFSNRDAMLEAARGSR